MCDLPDDTLMRLERELAHRIEEAARLKQELEELRAQLRALGADPDKPHGETLQA